MGKIWPSKSLIFFATVTQHYCQQALRRVKVINHSYKRDSILLKLRFYGCLLKLDSDRQWKKHQWRNKLTRFYIVNFTNCIDVKAIQLFIVEMRETGGRVIALTSYQVRGHSAGVTKEDRAVSGELDFFLRNIWPNKQNGIAKTNF